MSATIEDVTRGRLAEHFHTAPAIITPSIEGREHLLAEAAESVQAQTVEVQHHVGLDTTRVGPAVIRSTILRHLDPAIGHVAFLDDDDLLDPNHIETLLAAMDEDDSDLAFSWHRTVSTPNYPAPQVERVKRWDDYAWGVMLGGRNLIPVTVLAKRALVIEAGCFNEADRYEDFSLWMRMLSLGARITPVPRETWTYRFLGGNRTWEPR